MKSQLARDKPREGFNETREQKSVYVFGGRKGGHRTKCKDDDIQHVG